MTRFMYFFATSKTRTIPRNWAMELVKNGKCSERSPLSFVRARILI